MAAPGLPGETRLTRWLFLRLLGVIYLVAFASLAVQVRGLMGAHGVAPVAGYLAAARQQLGNDAIRLLPSLVWLNSSDAALIALCWGGVAAAALVVANLAPAAALAVCWALYLSLTVAGQTFLSFQWDALLLETGFLAIFLAPLHFAPRRPSSEAPPSAVMTWLVRWLLARLMFSSGVVKLTSGDPTWRNLTALDFHFETQPLPTWIGWYAHQLPGIVHRAMTAAQFVIELAVPLLVFAGRRARAWAAAAFAGFELVILLTGNYTFFNWLTLVLCIALLDDAHWPERLRRWLLAVPETPPRRHSGAWPPWVVWPVASVLALLSLAVMAEVDRRPRLLPRWLAAPAELAQPFRVVNGYGLFAVMTTTRPELVIEGSADGLTWREYEFRWKPGDLRHRPGFVAPHQPRLDWQMWFAALGNVYHSVWASHLCERLLDGTPEVLALLGPNPFPETPPRYVRILLYRYRFTDRATRQRDGTWWQREYLGVWARPFGPSPVTGL